MLLQLRKHRVKDEKVKELIKTLGESFKDVEKSIFQSSNNVFMDAVMGWKTEGERHTFLDDY